MTGGAALALALLLAGCGQKGPLYLPETQGAPSRPASAPAGTTPPAPQSPMASAPASGPPG
jgi:predicted small lipoprotein YifL